MSCRHSWRTGSKSASDSRFTHVRRLQPIGIGLGHAQAQRLGQPQHRLPEIVVVGDDQPRVAVAKPAQARQCRLAILEQTDGAGHDDDVERPVQ